MFTYSDYIIADGRSFYSMCQCEVIESFYPIRQDYNKLRQAGCILEICEKTIPSGAPCDDLLLLVLKTLQRICRYEGHPETLGRPEVLDRPSVSLFLFRFLLFHGLEPMMDQCCLCGDMLASYSSLFCYEGMICLSCKKSVPINKARMSLSPACQEAVRHIIKSSLNKAFMFRANDVTMTELAQAAELCFRGHFHVDLQSDILSPICHYILH